MIESQTLGGARTVVPAPPAGAVPRPRLLESLARGVHGPLTAVTGPPGAGKTAAVSCWAAGAAWPVAWVSLNERDHRPAEFWPLVFGALGRAGVTGPPTERAGLAAALADRDRPAVLVLDDFRAACGRELADDLLGAAGPALRLVLVSRDDPPLPLHRLRLAGGVTEIRGADLEFEEREAHALLERRGVTLPAEATRALRDRFEGWAAGLCLASMELERCAAPEAAAGFAGDDRAVVDYLEAEVLDAEPPEVRRLLLRLSAVDRFDAELAVELGGAEDGALFADVVRRVPFVVALEPGWYRFHRAFASALGLLLRHESPTEVAPLHRRAAAWSIRRGRLDEAVRHAVAAKDHGYASWLMVDGLAAGRLLGLVDGEPLEDVAGDLGRCAVPGTAEPEPLLVAACVAAASGDEAACAEHLEHADRLLASLPGDQAPPARLTAALVRASGLTPLAADPERAAAELDRALDRLPGRAGREQPQSRALARYGHALSDLRAGRLAEAAEGFRAALPAASTGGDLQHRRCLGALALTEALQGRIRQAHRHAAALARLPEVSVRPAGRRSAAAHLARAWTSLADARIEDAWRELAGARAAVEASPDPLWTTVTGLLRARLDIATGSAEVALKSLTVLREEGAAPAWLDRRLTLAEAEAHAALGLPMAEVPDPVAAARVLLGTGDVEGACRALRPALADAASAAPDVRVEAWLLESCLAYRTGNGSRGRRSLDRALRLAEHERFRLPFVVAGDWLPAVLRRDPELARAHHGLLGPLLPDGAGPGTAAGPEVFGELSTRELDVLKLVAEMLTTEEIAAELFVSVNTVKTHLKNIYRKLAVTRRGEAVRRAHHLNLL